MDRTERRVAGEKLHTIGVVGHVIAHELYRVGKVHKSGLTEKEQKFVMRRHEELRKLLEDVTTMCERCRK